MRDYFDRAPGINKAREIEQQLELFKKDPEEFFEKLKRHSPNEFTVKSEISKLLTEINFPLTDKSPEGKIYSSYDSEYLKNILKNELKKAA
ncbi:MAG: hypothetical protein NDI62_00295 [Burkholderiales bacterium]|nr:hypothetical protein [Burkholderiales bacterium]